jgi:hypothetical protein
LTLRFNATVISTLKRHNVKIQATGKHTGGGYDALLAILIVLFGLFPLEMVVVAE